VAATPRRLRRAVEFIHTGCIRPPDTIICGLIGAAEIRFPVLRPML